jgi:transcriptional regulator with XRE-family HTH domain
MPTGKTKRKPIRTRVATPFASNLKAIMSERGLNIKMLSEIAGVNHSVVMNWLNGGVPANLMAVQRLSRALKLNFEALLTGSSTEISPKEISLSQIFNEQIEPAFSGVFKIEAKRLTRKGD